MVRLNSIKDAFNYAKRDKYLVTDKAWIQDARKTYQVGQISEKTGLQKTETGWRIPRSLGAQAVKYKAKNDTAVKTPGGFVTLKEGTEVTNIEIIAQGHGIDSMQKLLNKYKKPNGTKTKATDWTKKKGIGTVETKTGKSAKVELHWYECKGLGKFEFKVKKWNLEK